MTNQKSWRFFSAVLEANGPMNKPDKRKWKMKNENEMIPIMI